MSSLCVPAHAAAVVGLLCQRVYLHFVYRHTQLLWWACYVNVYWEGSTTVAHAVVWRNSVVWSTGGNTALWLVENCNFFGMCAVWISRPWVL